MSERCRQGSCQDRAWAPLEYGLWRRSIPDASVLIPSRMKEGTIIPVAGPSEYRCSSNIELYASSYAKTVCDKQRAVSGGSALHNNRKKQIPKSMFCEGLLGREYRKTAICFPVVECKVPQPNLKHRRRMLLSRMALKTRMKKQR